MNQALGSPIVPPRRLLDRPELIALVRRVAARPEWWAERLEASGAERTYAELHRGEHLDVWAIGWRPTTTRAGTTTTPPAARCTSWRGS